MSSSSEEKKRKELVENILSDYDSTKTRLVIIYYTQTEDIVDSYLCIIRQDVNTHFHLILNLDQRDLTITMKMTNHLGQVLEKEVSKDHLRSGTILLKKKNLQLHM